jgi:L-ascorbate metabolism protein UlaG (beta-lactamase superfamily)
LFIGASTTLWVSWVIIGSEHKTFFSGDIGNYPGLAEIGDKFGPFDLTLIECGAYDPMWPDLHLNPEQAAEAHMAVKGKLMLPIHWGTFNLAFHNWFDPPERLLIAAESNQVKVVFPHPGQIVTVDDPPDIDCWWREYE